MKKTIICGEIENNTLYFGIPEVDGEFILTTSGDPTCLNELEDANADETICAINDLLNDPATPWEDCTTEDAEYVAEWLNVWGIA